MNNELSKPLIFITAALCSSLLISIASLIVVLGNKQKIDSTDLMIIDLQARTVDRYYGSDAKRDFSSLHKRLDEIVSACSAK